MFRSGIETAIQNALKDMGAEDVVFVVERPSDMAHGDYATNVALAAAKILKKNPRDVAAELQSKLENSAGVEKTQVAGAGFINFYLSHDALTTTVKEAAEDSWGKGNTYAGKKVLVEYTSPNLFKPLHIGNLIGNILGESIARLFEASGADVKRLNYPSDIGLTIAKGVWGLQKHNLNPENIAELGKAYVLGNEAYESSEAKEQIEEINRALYAGSNAEWSTLREKGIATSLKHLHELCVRLGTKGFDKEFFESQSGVLGQKIVSDNIGSVFEVSDGATVYHGEHTRVFLNSQGLPTYEAKEVGLFELKSNAYPNFDISITVTGKEQTDFFRIVFEAIRKVFPGKTNGKDLLHVPTSFLKLTTGKMSSRLGNVITGESLLAEVTEAARGREDVAVGALKYTVLKQGSGKDIVFDPEKSLSLEGDSGPYVQYALVRARSLLRQAKDARMENAADGGRSRPLGQALPSASILLRRSLVHFPDVVARAAGELEPHHVVTYLTELAAAFNSWYAAERLIVDGTVSADALALVQAVEHTLHCGLDVLGIPSPEEM
ncbi:MAG TPA: arginine--tRNA ligase [Candidatus Paceibacterota bacterium]|nr:arginine--tRNA ligase [Candidatus Paceibacterota bacterium]